MTKATRGNSAAVSSTDASNVLLGKQLQDADHWQRLVECRHHDPFGVLGLHAVDSKSPSSVRLTLYRPDAVYCELLLDDDRALPFSILPQAGAFELLLDANTLPVGSKPRIRMTNSLLTKSEYCDPYSFGPVICESELQRFYLHPHPWSYRFLGAHWLEHEGCQGVLFAVWAPNAERVSVVADFNRWDGRIHPMRNRGDSGVWELFLPDIPEHCHYKFEVRNRNSGETFLKSDPYASEYAVRPDTASVLVRPTPYEWGDEVWMTQRHAHQWQAEPMSIYEVHLGSWRRDSQGKFLDYATLAHELVAYARQMGFTHLQLMPVSEHPFDGSWGYQVTGYFAPTSRFGSPDQFRYFVDYCHQQGIGVLLDWVPAHFPRDDHALAQFDGSALYEHADPRQGEHRDWGTLIFNYGRNEVMNFLLSSACCWLEEFHIDGLRVDAVASMLYLDYSREPGDWTPNRFGGRENLDAIHFLQTLNSFLHQQFPGCVVVAEESTSWPGVSRPVYTGGLGFTMKWNMGWMNDTLEYFSKDPVHRPYHHEHLTFGLLYAFSENFVLPLSHDEVVHGKRSILNKMPGDAWQRFAQVRLLYSYMFTYPGKKLLFMGNEFAQGQEWNHDAALEWHVLEHPFQRGVQQLVRDLNQLYQTRPALHRFDFDAQGFQWIDCHDHAQSVISFIRRADDDEVIVVMNATPVVREHYRIGVTRAGIYQEVLNSDSHFYGGSNVSNGIHIASVPESTMGFEQCLELTLPPLGLLILARRETA